MFDMNWMAILCIALYILGAVQTSICIAYDILSGNRDINKTEEWILIIIWPILTIVFIITHIVRKIKGT